MSKEIMNLTQLCAYLGIPRRTLYVMIDDKRFPVAPIKGVYPRKWSKEHVDVWKNAQ